MTKEQYYEKLKAIELEYDAMKKTLYREYAFANNPYKVGDFVTDHIGTIKIEKIQAYKAFDLPSCVYTGTQYKKDGTLSKKQNHTVVNQINIVE
jgi:hypothetical protein